MIFTILTILAEVATTASAAAHQRPACRINAMPTPTGAGHSCNWYLAFRGENV